MKKVESYKLEKYIKFSKAYMEKVWWYWNPETTISAT